MDTRKLLLPTLIAAVLAAPLAFAQDTNAEADKDQAATEQAAAAEQADVTTNQADVADTDTDKEKDKDKAKKDQAEEGEQAAEPEEDDKK